MAELAFRTAPSSRVRAGAVLALATFDRLRRMVLYAQSDSRPLTTRGSPLRWPFDRKQPNLVRSLIIFTLVGVGAQLVDGALGMAFGVTASTLLVLSGVASAQASAAVHLAEVGTTFASGLSHWKFKNIDWGIVLELGVPGAVGAFLGATVLSSLSTEDAAPVMAAILLAIGVYVLLRFSLRTPPAVKVGHDQARREVPAPLGLFGGFIDASGGGGWGPVTTSTLLSQRQDRAAHRHRLGERVGVPGRGVGVGGLPDRPARGVLRQPADRAGAGDRRRHRRAVRRLAGQPRQPRAARHRGRRRHRADQLAEAGQVLRRRRRRGRR